MTYPELFPAIKESFSKILESIKNINNHFDQLMSYSINPSLFTKIEENSFFEAIKNYQENLISTKLTLIGLSRTDIGSLHSLSMSLKVYIDIKSQIAYIYF